MLGQAEGMVREIKQELGHLPSEPVYEPITEENTQKYTFKSRVCCGKTFLTPQQWAGHRNSAVHRKNGKEKGDENISNRT